MPRSIAVVGVCLTLTLSCLNSTPVWSQRPALQPGLIAEITSADGQLRRRTDEVPAVFQVNKRAIDSRSKDGAFTITWQGRLMSQTRGTYRLHAFVEHGQTEVLLNGQRALGGQTATGQWFTSAPTELPFDWHRIKISFTSTAPDSRFSLFWSGPGFQLEPISERFFYHEQQLGTGVLDVQRAETLVHALRCKSCHQLPVPQPLPAPALDRLAGNLRRDWLISWLSAPPASDKSVRRMPHFSFSQADAHALADYLIGDTAASGTQSESTEEQIRAGGKLVLTRGCLACHGINELGDSNIYGGGDLTAITSKRPAGFIAQWLADPSQLNRHHRMPTFSLKETERQQIAAHLESLSEVAAPTAAPAPTPASIARGRDLFQAARCNACHLPPNDLPQSANSKIPVGSRLDATSNWDQSCLQQADRDKLRPGFLLPPADAKLVREFIQQASHRQTPASPTLSGKLLMAENNCLACHKRGSHAGLAGKMPDVVDEHPEFGPLIPAMTPPALTSIGDKLHDASLAQAVERASGDRRPWLTVKMPRFHLTKEQRQAIVEHLVASDRIPENAPTSVDKQPATLPAATLELAGRRLVTTDGFGCTSCHQVGSQKPPKAPLNAKGPDLAMLQKHIRKPWFDRWVRNPARIVPRMEMPSVQTPVQGVLDNQLDDQLAAVWHVLNQPNFEPPQPNPVRVLRRSGVASQHQRAVFVTDVVRAGQQQFIKPLLIGLPNRHNILFDFESGRLHGWTIGDVARQRTQGKSWYWELAGTNLLPAEGATTRFTLQRADANLSPQRSGQFVTAPALIKHTADGLEFSYRLQFPNDESTAGLQVTERMTPYSDDGKTAGFRRSVVFRGLSAQEAIQVRVAGQAIANEPRSRQLAGGHRITLTAPATARFTSDGGLTVGATNGVARITLLYTTTLPADRFVITPPQIPPPAAEQLHVVPGFTAVRLPAFAALMPTGLTWRPDGSLIITSLKGRVWTARDTNRDGLEDDFQPFSDELAAPFGAAAFGENSVDVVNKYGLLRLTDADQDGFAESVRTLATGWGHTADYHDWAIGLPRDADGNYFVSTACQQDQRSAAAARHRGEVLKLVPNDDATQYTLQPVSAGHRFPVGIARNRAGQLFVTDNQGNFNPFNELNHVQQGKRYGFINKIDRRPDFQPRLTAPAIDIPHPWTRSVNGICFLESPDGRAFGVYEGHLVGCEYDTRQLIRMSLQPVGQVIQGAAYPFTYYQPKQGPSLLGPLVCAVSPQADLYVGCIRDSGWGGSNNIGTIVKLTPDLASLPAGIAEVRATPTGFAIDFTQPVAVDRAGDLANYSVVSYTRTSTPAYGGPDQDRRQETIQRVQLAPTGDRVQLELETLRAGYVYELRLKNIAQDGGEFYPAEAFYTMRVIPEK